LSKVMTIGVHLVALPLALHALGVERFGAFVMITALLSWLNLSSAGLFPGLTREISRCSFADRHQAASLFTAAFYLSGALALVSGVIATAALLLIPVSELFGDGFEPYAREIRFAGHTAIAVLVLQVVSGVAEAVRAGAQQQHVNNLWGTVGNLLSLALLVVAALWVPSIAFIVLAVHGSITLAKLANLIHLMFVSDRIFCPRWSLWNRSTARRLMRTGSAFLLVQIAAMANQQVSAYVVGYIGGPNEVAVFSVMLRLVVILGGTVVMVTQPVWPALTEALHRGDLAWGLSRAKWLVLGLSLYATSMGFIVAVLGKQLVELWMGAEIAPTGTLLALTGAYFAVVVWNHVHYTLLVAMGETWFPARILATEACLMMILCALLVPKYGAEGGMVALLAAGLVVTGWRMPLSVRRHVARMRA
jgi:O-antigen/teichoic acid export membrane protein